MARPEGLTPEQEAIVSSDAHRLVVTASAGAGKTRVLVDRYLRHVTEDGIAPDAILTVTFTRKAAAEMKGRIVRALRDRRLFGEAQVAETGPIQTIHSFCERLLRENAIEAGLDPEFEILGEAQSSGLLAESIRETLSAPTEDSPCADSLISVLAGRHQRARYGAPYARLESAIGEVLRELRGSGHDLHELRIAHRDPESLVETWRTTILNNLSPSVLKVLPECDADFQSSLASAFKSVDNRVPAWLRQQFDAQSELENARHVCGLVQLASEVWSRLEQRMDELQKLDFSALEARAVRLLAICPSVRERLRSAYSVALIDEAQDLSPVQYKLLGGLELKLEMMVGDPQQSIYGFRQADVELFKARAAEGSEHLGRNHRSDPGVLRFVDQVFGCLWSADYTPMGEVASFSLDSEDECDYLGVELWEMPTRDSAPAARFVAQLIDEGCLAKEITVLTRDAFGSAQALKELQSAGIEARIAGGSERFFTRMEVRDLANTLRASADPRDDFALLACLRSPVCGLSLDSIVLLAPRKPVFESLNEFEPPLDEDAPKLRNFIEWFVPLTGHADRLSAWEVLSEVFAKSQYLNVLARRRNSAQLLANVRKLLSLAASEPELGPADYADRIRSIQEIRHKEGDAPAYADESDVVTIMTIHKAKGLEFESVVLPQTHKKLTNDAGEVLADPRIGLLATKFGKDQCLLYRFLDDRRKQRAIAEELRVLYVAMTRAKRRLCVVLYPPASQDNLSKRIRGAIGAAPLPGVRYRRPEA